MKKKSATPYNAQTGFRLSRAAIRKINAVEGIDLDGRIAEQLEEFDRQQLTPEQRREAVRLKFAKAAT